MQQKETVLSFKIFMNQTKLALLYLLRFNFFQQCHIR